jgi:TPR repeat protein
MMQNKIMTKLFLLASLMLSLAGCLELEDFKLSRHDLVQPRGIEGRWSVKYFGSKDAEKIAQIRATVDGTLLVSLIDGDAKAEKVQHWSISLINTSSEEMFIAVIKSQDSKDSKMILGALFKAQNMPGEITHQRMHWVLYLYNVDKGASHEEASQWLKDRYGLRYAKTNYGAAIQGNIDARALRQMTGDPNWTRYFKVQPYAGITPLPKSHPPQAQLDKPLAKSAQRASDHSAQLPAELVRSLEALAARAEAGDAEAQFRLGLYLQYSQPLLEGKHVDYGRIVDLYKRAAAQGHAKASFELAQMYEKGVGVQKDINRAIQLYTVAAKAGYADAMGKLGAAYVEVGNWNNAVQWSQKAAELGNPIGLNSLGAFYHAGRGVNRDYARAMYFYRKAADAGDCYALMNIGGLYYNGDGVRQDRGEATKWFQKAKDCNASLSAYINRYMEKIRSGDLPKPQRASGRPDQTISTAGLVAVLAIAAVVAAAANSQAPAPAVEGKAQGRGPACGQEVGIFPAREPCGRDWRPWGQWKGSWCYSDFNWDSSGSSSVTFCTNGYGTWQRSALLDECVGVEGWCKD